MSKDQEYLSRPLIEDVCYCITEDSLLISSPNTVYVKAKSYKPLEKDAILQLYTELLRAAKQCGVKIAYRAHLRRSIVQNWAEYEKDCGEAQRLYAEMIDIAKEVACRGLHHGTIDDPVLKVLMAIEEKYQALFCRNRGISQIAEVQCRLESLLGSFCRLEGSITIYL